MTKFKKADIFFAIALLLVLSLHIVFTFVVPFSDDESFYTSIPFRLLGDDSLVQHEWHLSQFSSLFSFLPVLIYTTIKGSADGIIFFMRIIFLIIHTSIAVVIYRVFRKHDKWAVMAAITFYMHTAYAIKAISYQSMFLAFILLLTLCLLSIYEKPTKRLYMLSGICFGFCCVNNPLFCLAFPIYLFICLLWAKRQEIKSFVLKIKNPEAFNDEKKLTRKQKNMQKQQVLDAFPELEKYDCFFGKEAFLRIVQGLLIAGAVAVVFFLITGGTISSVTRNIENLLSSTEYGISPLALIEKMKQTVEIFSQANYNVPWILPLLFIVLLFDKKRYKNTHRFAYLTISILWSIFYICGAIEAYWLDYFCISLPFFITSTLCYILTENKNKTLFRCMYIPGLIATFFQYLAANTHLAAIGIVLTVCNVAGVFFVMDLCNEIRSTSKEKDTTAVKKVFSGLVISVLIISFCFQTVLYITMNQYWGPLPKNDLRKPSEGPYAGLYMDIDSYNYYCNEIKDLNYIKEITRENDPVLLASYRNWMYMYLERPVAIYTTWYQGELKKDLLIRYYEENPDRIPEYVYVESLDLSSTRYQVAEELFEFSSKEVLSNGVLYTVDYYKF